MHNWREIRLAEVIDIKHGFAFRGEFFSHEPSNDILVTPANFAIGGGFQLNKPKFYVGPVPEDYVLGEGDLIVTMTDLSKEADTLGYSAIVPSSEQRFLHNQRIGRVRSKTKDVYLPFIAWLMRTRAYREEIVSSATGSTVKHTSPARILAYKFKLPPLLEQREIASVLGALDDKIELNRQMNETLEAMARAIFKDWFVDFGPTRAKMEGRAPYLAPDTWSLFPDKLDDDDRPEGWIRVQLADLIEVNPPEPLRRGNFAPYLDMASLPVNGPNPEPYVVRQFGSGMRFRNGDALLARITPCLENGKTAYVQNLPENEVGWGSTEFIVLRSRPPIPKAFAYLLARDPVFRASAIQSMTGTSGRQRASNDAVSAYPLVRPATSDLWKKLSFLINPMFDRISASDNESRTLAATRDLLLPKLMSGEIRIRDAEKSVEAVL